MKVVLISDGRHLEGATSRAMNALMTGIRAAGGECEKIALARMKVAHCRECLKYTTARCLTEGECSIEDDFASIVNKVRQADAVALATLVYLSDCDKSLRAFLHRLAQICRYRDGRSRLGGTPVVAVCIGAGAAICIKKLKRLLVDCGMAVFDVATMGRNEVVLHRKALASVGKRLATLAALRSAEGVADPARLMRGSSADPAGGAAAGAEPGA